jgi:hypothetical protein
MGAGSSASGSFFRHAFPCELAPLSIRLTSGVTSRISTDGLVFFRVCTHSYARSMDHLAAPKPPEKANVGKGLGGPSSELRFSRSFPRCLRNRPFSPLLNLQGNGISRLPNGANVFFGVGTQIQDLGNAVHIQHHRNTNTSMKPKV